MGNMIGHLVRVGPGGKRCYCCSEAPGKPRLIERRAFKRGKLNDWRRALRKDQL